jgi:hypothetical protein
VSLLISEGHANAGDYPLAYLVVETEIAKDRINAHTKTLMTLTQSAIASAFSKKGASAFNKQISEL